MISKRFLASTMAIIMTFTTFSPVMAATPNESVDMKTQVLNYLAEKEADNTVWEYLKLSGKSESSEVRIIVELEDKAVIDYAIQQGVSVADMNQAEVEKVSDDLVNQMDAVQKEIAKEDINVEIHEEFVSVINGFSATTTIADAKKIEALPNVKNVLISNEYTRPEPVQPSMTTSNQMVHSQQAWDLDLKGTGMLVAVIDSSFDPTHPSMQTITDPSKAAIKTQADLPGGLPGHFYNIKMPYAYNYYDHSDVLAAASDHGTHVAGTVAANGDTAAGGIKGVAPEAQVLGMKVFGNDPSISTTYDDIYIKAIEDAITLGADAINMSLGSTAGFLQTEEEDPARAALRKAAESGIIISISAGNSDRFGSGNGNPMSTVPDTGVLGSPSVNPDSFSVASIENTHVMAPTIITSGGAIRVGFQTSGAFDPITVFNGEEKEYVYCGIGNTTDFTGKDLEGKIALIQRGSLGFGVKVLNAQNAKAAGVIIFNSAAGGDALMGMSFGAEEASITIPAVFVGLTKGTALKNAAVKSLKFTTEMTSVVNPKGGIMSDFTSWGPTPNLDFKPEITAPGGNIYSTLQGGAYGLMSGTSMAAPHVAGGAALILERIDSQPTIFGGVTGANRSKMAKNLMMSTANPVMVDYTGAYVSPRQGGAGIMDLQAAATSNVIIVDKSTGVSKVNLKQMTGKTATFDLSVINMGTEAVNYDLSGTVQTDYAGEGQITIYPIEMGKATITYTQNGQTITSLAVEPGKTVDFTVNVDVTTATVDGTAFDEVYPNGGFVDGFVRLVDKADALPSIGLPYMGFCGDWTAAPIIDKSIYDMAEGETGFYGEGYNGLYTEIPKKAPFLGGNYEGKFIKENIAISPNADGYYDYAGSYFTFLRNAKNLDVTILDSTMKPVRTVSLLNYVTKNYFDGDAKNPKAKDFGVWDGKVNNQIVEGQYYYQIRSKVDYPNAEWQTQVYPITVDITEPVVSTPVYNKDAKTITATANDNFKKLKTVHLLINGKLVDTVDGTGLSEVVFTLPDVLPDNTTFEVLAVDYAYNVGVSSSINRVVVDDKTGPAVDMPKPVSTDLVGTNEVLFEGTVTDPAGLKSFTFDGTEVPVTFDAATSVYSFSQKLTFKDGSHGVKVIATDFAGNKTEYEKKFYVDGTAPVITLTNAVPADVQFEVKTVKLSGVATDNFSGLKVFVNGSMISNVSGKMDAKPMVEVRSEFKDVVITLVEGKNVITIEAVDNAGNKKETTYVVNQMPQGKAVPTPIYSGGGSSSVAPAPAATTPVAPAVVAPVAPAKDTSTTTPAPTTAPTTTPVKVDLTKVLKPEAKETLNELKASKLIGTTFNESSKLTQGLLAITVVKAFGITVDKGDSSLGTLKELGITKDLKVVSTQKEMTRNELVDMMAKIYMAQKTSKTTNKAISFEGNYKTEAAAEKAAMEALTKYYEKKSIQGNFKATAIDFVVVFDTLFVK